MKALVHKEKGIKMKFPKGTGQARHMADYVSGIGKCPKCNKEPHSYAVSIYGGLRCMSCCELVEEVNGCVVLEGKDHYPYKEAPRVFA